MLSFTRLLTGTSLRKSDNVFVKVESHEWEVSRSLLRSVSNHFSTELKNPSVKIVECSGGQPAAFELFLQWLYTDRYKEYDGYAPALEGSEQCNSLEHQTEKTATNMVWCFKAAIMAHDLGDLLHAPRFQNYAVQRLFQACGRENPKANVTPATWWNAPDLCKLELFIKDYIIQNWGDRTVVNHELKEWAEVFGDDWDSLAGFMQAMGTPLHVRQEQSLVLEKYLLQTD
jgi:hypothetical protein